MDWQSFLQELDTDYVCDGNLIKHLPSDDFYLHSLWEEIDEARKSVWMVIFLMEADSVGLSTLDRLTAAARRGCDVRLIYDAWASRRLKPKHFADFREAGGRAAPFHPYWPPQKKSGAFSIRNHRKYTIIDHDHGWLGSQNLSEKFAGSELGKWLFDDDMAHLEGPCISFLSSTFAHTWMEVAGETLEEHSPGDACDGGCTAAILTHDPRHQPSILDDTINRAVAGATRRCYLSTPFFVPDQDLTDALIQALRQGADVQINTAGSSEWPVALAAGRSRYGALLEAGARIFEVQSRIVHSKTLAIDGELGIIGSFNMDLWTTEHMLDIAVLAANEEVARSLEEEFADHLGDSREITLEEYRSRPWFQRANERFSDAVLQRLT